ncbi:MAG: flagellar hook-associated protein FlgK [Lachnospiraceae bacterium]|nr:flagellar hook-associated protein FlgK [Lachnospiraceae bacterium]
MSLLTSFNAGVAGINTAQSGLNTTAHNVGNTKTAGFTRQQYIQTDMYYTTLKTTDKSALQVGSGSTVAEVRQIRDIFLDRQYRTEAGRLEFYDILYTTENEMEDMLGELEGVEFQNSLQTLWDQIQEMSKNPEGITLREEFIANAQAFLERAQNIYQGMRDYQVSMNTQIQEQVDRINSIADQLAVLNERIATAESSGLENANDYRDQRNLLLDELAKYTYYEYKEHTNHMVEVRINNAPLVDDTRVHHLKTQTMEVKHHIPGAGMDEDGYMELPTPKMYEVVWETGGYGDVYHLDEAYSREKNTDVGSLLGILTARGKTYGYYTDIPLREDYVSDYAYSKAVDEYNNTTGNCLLEELEAQFDLLMHKVIVAINDAFAPNVELSYSDEKDADGNVTSFQTNIGLMAADGSATQLSKLDATNADEEAVTIDLSNNKLIVRDTNGDPVGEPIDLKNIKLLDASRCPVGADENETIGTELFVRRTVEDEARYDVYEVAGPLYLLDENGDVVKSEKGFPIALTQRVQEKNADGTLKVDSNNEPIYKYKLYVYREEDPMQIDTLYTMQNVEVDPKILENYSYLPVKGNEALGNYGTYDINGVFGRMVENWNASTTMLDPNTLAKYDIDQLYKAMVSGLDIQGSVWKSQVENQERLTESVEDKRQQVSGVATDEEMISLLMYQHAYNAASRYITVIDEMLEHIIERLG